MKFKENLEEAETFDQLKSKIVKYILYKKRSEQEVRQKFCNEDENLLEDIIAYLKEAGYIDDKAYIEKSIKEFMTLKNLSIKEISYKICQKGIDKNLVDTYISQNKEMMLQYEINSAKKLILKKMNDYEIAEIKNGLYKKGFLSETVNIAFDEVENES